MVRYVIGFVLSLLLTVIAFGSVEFGWLNGIQLLLAISGLALIQAVVQFYYFLHLGEEIGPRYKLLSLLFMLLILAIIVGGSLWIMHHLNYNMMEMSPEEKDYYMTSQKDKGF